MNHLRCTALAVLTWLSPLILKSQCTSFPVVNLGNDTSICDVIFTLNAGNAGMDFLWNTSDTSQQLNVNSSGQYSVTVTDSLGCSTNDTINIAFNPPSVAGIISLDGGDTILCGNENTIFYSNGHTGYVLWWVMDTINWVWAPFGSGDTLDYGPSPNNMSGVYTIMATATNGNCPADTSNILNIALHSSPEVNLGPDDTLCGFNTYLYSGYPNEQNVWNNGDTTDYTIASVSGMYIVTVINSFGCRDSDTAVYSVFAWPTVTYFCPIDTMCFTDGSFFLIQGTPTGGSFSGVNVWNDMFYPLMGGSNLVVYSWTDTISGCTGTAGDYIWVDTCVGVTEYERNNFSVYPNPATDDIIIEIAPYETTIEILNVNGQVILTAYNSYRNDQVEVDISNLAAGIYFIRVSNNYTERYSQFVRMDPR